MANCSNCIKKNDCCSAGKMSGYCGGYSPAKITNQEAILSGKIPLEHIVCGFNRLCGRCQTDRKICNAELNCGCGRQWLMAEYKTEFICDYTKSGINQKLEKVVPDMDVSKQRQDPQKRTRQQVYATGNKWAIENFRDTHN